MKKFLKNLFIGIFVILPLLLAGGAAFLRYNQRSFDPARDVDGVDGVMLVSNAGAFLYGATIGTNEIALFDAGMDVKGRPIIGLLSSLGSGRTITHVFVTHGHPDHIAGISTLRQAKVFGGKADADLMNFTRPNPKPLARWLVKILETRPVKLTHALESRQAIDVGGAEKVVAIPFPGHSPGSFLYFHRGVLYAGDSLNHRKGKLEGGMEIFNDDTALNHASIKTLPALLSGLDVKTVCTGHGGCTKPEDTQRLLEELVAAIQ